MGRITLDYFRVIIWILLLNNKSEEVNVIISDENIIQACYIYKLYCGGAYMYCTLFRYFCLLMD